MGVENVRPCKITFFTEVAVILIKSTITCKVCRNESNALLLPSRGQSKRGHPCQKPIANFFSSVWFQFVVLFSVNELIDCKILNNK